MTQAVRDPAPAGLSRFAVELVVAAGMSTLSVLVIWDNLRIGAGWGNAGPQPGYFPLRIGAAVGLCSLIVAWQAWRSRSDALFVSWLQLKRVAQVLVPLTVYVGCITFVGIYVASSLFIAAFMLFAGGYALWKGLVLGMAANALMFYVFEIQFKVPLPKGPLESWLGH